MGGMAVLWLGTFADGHGKEQSKLCTLVRLGGVSHLWAVGT